MIGIGEQSKGILIIKGVVFLFKNSRSSSIKCGITHNNTKVFLNDFKEIMNKGRNKPVFLIRQSVEFIDFVL